MPLNQNFEQMVKEFHEKYGHLIVESPTCDIPDSVKNLRKKLIIEEFEELITAIDADDIVEIADGAMDLMYVILGTMISYGIPTERCFTEVHRSNMTKTPVKATEGQKYGTKTPKGPDFIAPNLMKILIYPKSQTALEIKNEGKNDSI